MSNTCNYRLLYSWIWDLSEFVYNADIFNMSPRSTSSSPGQKVRRPKKKTEEPYYRHSILETTSKSIKNLINTVYNENNYHYKIKQHEIKQVFVKNGDKNVVSFRSSTKVPNFVY